MAIDPEVLKGQRAEVLSVVRKGECRGCGAPTTAKKALCSDCSNGRNPARVSTPKLFEWRRAIDEELRRRKEEIEDVLGGKHER